MVEKEFEHWKPKTKLGKMVKEGEITGIKDIWRRGYHIMESEIVDYLVPDLEEEVLDVTMVQRMTDSGRRINFRTVVVVGNREGFVGLGQSRAKEVGPAIRKAVDTAKLNLVAVRRGCGSWECRCKDPHSIAFEVTGKAGSVGVALRPAPKGIGLAIGDAVKPILALAGVKDIWSNTKGQTGTTLNFAKATYNALKKTSAIRISDKEIDRLGIVEGS